MGLLLTHLFHSQNESAMDNEAFDILKGLAKEKGLDVAGGDVRRTSSRFCFGVEHGDYNGTELFGVGTDRFIWMAYKPNGTDRCLGLTPWLLRLQGQTAWERR